MQPSKNFIDSLSWLYVLLNVDLSKFQSGAIQYKTHQGVLDLGRRKVGIKLSASLDLGAAKNDDDVKKEGDSKSPRFAGSSLSPIYAYLPGSAQDDDDDFSTPYIELSQFEDKPKPKIQHQEPLLSSSVKRLQPGQSPAHRRSQSAGGTSVRCEISEASSKSSVSPTSGRLRGRGSDGGRSMNPETQKRFAASTDAECSLGSALNGSPLPPKHKRVYVFLSTNNLLFRRGKKRSLDSADPLSPQNRRTHRSSVCSLPSQRFRINESENQDGEKVKPFIRSRETLESAGSKLSKVKEEAEHKSLLAGTFSGVFVANDSTGLNIKIFAPLFVLLVALCLMLAYTQAI